MSPLQAVDAHRILEPELSMAIHWGTFQLADDGRDEPVVDLRKAMAEYPGLPPFEAVENGEAIQIGEPHKK
jgi:L-ascorbate metabolism protein UlaG (beta-lactamase superfamily)